MHQGGDVHALGYVERAVYSQPGRERITNQPGSIVEAILEYTDPREIDA